MRLLILTWLICLKVWFVPFVYEVSTCCPGVFDIWSEENHIKADPGRPQSVQGGTPPQRFQKQVGRKTHHVLEGSSKWLQNGTPKSQG